MIAIAPEPPRDANESWETFAAVLSDEAASLLQVNAAAVYLTQVLVDGSPEAILEADNRVNAARLRHQNASTKRRSMQLRGFGSMPLQQVCGYAPRSMSPRFNQLLAQLSWGSISLGITVANNKSLIVAGLERLVQITSKMQQSASERTGVYKRRGYVAAPGASVLVSSQV
jgi:hypothetical protein